MKKLYLTLAALAALISFIPSQSQIVIFGEDFDQIPGPGAGGPGTYVFPPGWFLRNVDNRTPDPAVAYVNEAWERREDFGLNVTDSMAFSTSWYLPVGAADDWMWTPLIGPLPSNCELRWNARAYDALYPDGYEVRIMTSAQGPPTGGTGVLGNQVTNSTQVFSIGAENSTSTNRSVNLAAYTGQSIYVGFRNTSNDKFILVVDDIQVIQLLPYDGQMVSLDTVSEYTLTPKSQTGPLPLGGRIRNNGMNAVTNAMLNVRIYDSGNTLIHSASSSGTNLAPGSTADLTAGTWTPPTIADTYTLKFYTTIAQADAMATNDTMTTQIVVTDSTYARDNGNVIGSLGIGAGQVGYLGQEFVINNPGRISSVDMFVTRGWTGRRLAIAIWNMNAVEPTSILTTTDTLIYPDDSARLYRLPIYNGPITLPAGRYTFTAIEFDSTLAVGLTADIFTPNRTWVDWPSNPQPSWGNNEDYGAGFQRAYVIRPNMLAPCPAQIIQSTTSTPASCGGADGSVMVLTTGSGPFTYLWNTGATTDSVGGLAAGTYSVTVIDEYSFCSDTASVLLSNLNSPTATIGASTDVTCFGGTDGSATVNATGGTPGYSYAWAPSGGTSATANGLGAGTYTITVTDAGNCIGITTVTINQPTVVVPVITSSTDETCVGCNDGSATVTVSGGVGGYVYNWAPSGGTGSTASGLAPGTYTVTVTDANGCSETATVTINASSGVDDQIQNQEVNLFPNPNDGSFTLQVNIPYNGPAEIAIIDQQGRVVYNRQAMINATLSGNQIAIKGIAAGTYMLRFTADQKVWLRKLVVK